jgi:hypothetical protein
MSGNGKQVREGLPSFRWERVDDQGLGSDQGGSDLLKRAAKEEILRAVTAVADGEAIFGRPFTKLNVATCTEAAILARDRGLGHN